MQREMLQSLHTVASVAVLGVAAEAGRPSGRGPRPTTAPLSDEMLGSARAQARVAPQSIPTAAESAPVRSVPETAPPPTQALGASAKHGDFHGPWRPLPAKKVDWGEYLRNATGTEPPSGMSNPHAHHAVFKAGQPGKMSTVVSEAQSVVRQRAGIDPIWDLENLGWAPNKGHSIAVAEDQLSRLRVFDAADATPAEFEELLKLFKNEAAAR